MAMMMTGRVLLVCALCVLWCGAADGAVGVVSGGDDNILREVFIPVARLQESQEKRTSGATADAKGAAAETATKAKKAAEAESLPVTTVGEEEVKTTINDQDNSVEHHSGQKKELLKEEEPENREKEQHEKQRHQQRDHSARKGEEYAKDKTANGTNATAVKDDSDSSTAVSHTTSPLLLLLVVACAAAVVVA
ncbi:Mucin-associated surface protein (MASP) [Trypanosoma cruzi]|uniref:Mucin-associated surface protein (MASP), putative n=2 Tax=Trypanosoma cruzi TaxID=5693 RepID=Q4DB85_TRYCC|nr:mucin-associated surface protein (MASP), putative [Trypanosoma cruzi]EAN89786.1 mucin-associated surface protein (MASP), putative [Trypanosoma cruzi]PWV04393.1 Mucin-associated surface protein (MASP) [Trypanosoma cruzi]|eukprot:XP_811637.1 mucin-associated surface protein (MASP) [Trypanosoma cruzi strain CL Brener]